MIERTAEFGCRNDLCQVLLVRVVAAPDRRRPALAIEADTQVQVTKSVTLRLGEIGRYRAERYWNGIIDEMHCWRKALTAEEVQQAMEGILLSVKPMGKIPIAWGTLNPIFKTKKRQT